MRFSLIRAVHNLEVLDKAIRIGAGADVLDRYGPATNVLEQASHIEAKKVIARLVGQVGESAPEEACQVQERKISPLILASLRRPCVRRQEDAIDRFPVAIGLQPFLIAFQLLGSFAGIDLGLNYQKPVGVLAGLLAGSFNEDVDPAQFGAEQALDGPLALDLQNPKTLWGLGGELGHFCKHAFEKG